MVIKALKKRGVYNVDIAAELGVHPKTISRALKRERGFWKFSAFYNDHEQLATTSQADTDVS